MGKADRVRITIEMSDQFIRLLRSKMALKGLGVAQRGIDHDDRQHDVGDALLVVVASEALGAPLEQTHALLPIEWRDGIEPVDGGRSWRDAETGEWHVTT